MDIISKGGKPTKFKKLKSKSKSKTKTRRREGKTERKRTEGATYKNINTNRQTW